MTVRRAYCSAVDRMVPVQLKAGAAPRDHVSLRDPADLVCLDYKVRCTGWCCPLFSVEDDGASAHASAHAAAERASATRAAPHGGISQSRTKSRWTRPT